MNQSTKDRDNSPERLGVRRSVILVLAYSFLAVLMTWPLARHIHRDIAADLGDPAFNSWVLTWASNRILQFLHGDWRALSGYWSANIFYPAPLTLAYSDHLFTQMLQVLPVYAATGNMILGYNLLFLSTIVLSGVATFHLVRELTGRNTAAFLAGLAFAFAPYKLGQVSHVQMLSCYWMPLVFLWLRRYFVTRRPIELWKAAAALLAQNLSSGYYMLFFPAFAAAYVLYEAAQRRQLGDRRLWRQIGAAFLVVVALTLPFTLPYARVRALGDIGVRPTAEIVNYSADVTAYATAASRSWLWGIHGYRLLAYPKSEGEGFPGFSILAMAAIGLAATQYRRKGTAMLFYAGAAIVAALLALGPEIQIAGRSIGPGPYALFVNWLPGFDGLRVPARYLMLVALFLAVLAGFGASVLLHTWRRTGMALVLVACLGILVEGWGGSFPTNVRFPAGRFNLPPRGLKTGEQTSILYRWVRDSPPNTVLIEFPFGAPSYEAQYVFYAGFHGRPLVNGYSGFFPKQYSRLVSVLGQAPIDPATGTDALRSSGATHAIVHGDAFPGARAAELTGWLRSTGATLVATDRNDLLFSLK